MKIGFLKQRGFLKDIVKIATGLSLIATLTLHTAFAETLLTQKQRFTMKDFSTFYGDVIPEIQVGWESYGKLNSKKDNVILVTQYFTGTSHAAGKYSEDDKHSGYWDSIIGPGKAIDTNKYFVISSDTLVNLNVKNPTVITTGPATINPETGDPYGLDFPIVNIRDFVNVQHALLKSLSITKLHAVVGASMGSYQAIEWASAYPDMVEKVISIIGLGEIDNFMIAELDKWAQPIRQDPNWNQGNYYNKKEPIEGLINSLTGIILIGHHGQILDRRFKQALLEDTAPTRSVLNQFAVNDWLKKYAVTRSSSMDANHMLYMVRANQLFRLGHKKTLAEGIAPIKAKILLIAAKNDLLIKGYATKLLYSQLLIQKKHVIYDEIEGPWGHLDGIIAIAVKKDVIKHFIEGDPEPTWPAFGKLLIQPQ